MHGILLQIAQHKLNIMEVFVKQNAIVYIGIWKSMLIINKIINIPHIPTHISIYYTGQTKKNTSVNQIGDREVRGYAKC